MGIKIVSKRCCVKYFSRVTFLVPSFLELLPIVMSIEGAKSFLSEKLSQDPLEKFWLPKAKGAYQ